MGGWRVKFCKLENISGRRSPKQSQLIPKCQAHPEDQIRLVTGFTERRIMDKMRICFFKRVYGIQLQMLVESACVLH